MSNIPVFIVFNDFNLKSFHSDSIESARIQLIESIKKHISMMFINEHNYNIDDYLSHDKKYGHAYSALKPHLFFPESFDKFSYNCVNGTDLPILNNYFSYQISLNNEWISPWTQQELYSEALELVCAYLNDKINVTEPVLLEKEKDTYSLTLL